MNKEKCLKEIDERIDKIEINIKDAEKNNIIDDELKDTLIYNLTKELEFYQFIKKQLEKRK
jgi:hypothetical protein